VAGGDLDFNPKTPGSASSTGGYSWFNHFVVFLSRVLGANSISINSKILILVSENLGSANLDTNI
jgi:hypothetical protein